MKNELRDNKVSLLSQWKNKKATLDESVKISKAPEDARIPLSNGQRRLWFLQQLYPKSPVYNYSEIYVFKGRLDTEILLSALEKVCEDHDILRSTYHMEDGDLFIKIAPYPNMRVAKHDFSHLEAHEAEASAKIILTADARHSFSLSEHPIVLVSLVKINSNKHTLLLTLHHISTDKWSMGILRKELAKYYRAMLAGSESIKSGNTNIQFSDYTYWKQNQPIDTDQLAYWKNKLAGEIPIINLPTDFPKPAVPTLEGGAGPRQYFSKEHSTEILNLAKKMEVTPYVLFLSVYYMLLFRYCGQEDILIGTPIANRDQKALEDIIGFFNDTLVLRTKLSSGMRFKELVQQVRRTTLEAFSNKDVPFDTLVKELKQERSQSVHPFFQVMFLYHSVPKTPSFGSEVTLQHDFFDAGVSKFDLTLYISEEDGILSTTFEYTSDLFTETSIARIQAHFNLLIKGVVDNDECYVSQVPMITDTDKHFLLNKKTKQTAVFDSYAGIHEIIANISQTTPNKKALTFGDISISYGELEQRATSLALKILDKTNGQNKIVGLLTERSLEMIVGLYAILKSGCAYLPLDAKYPKQRLDFMIEDADVTLVILQEGLLSDFDALNLETLSISHDKDIVKGISIEFPKANRNNLAYMIYTSGSTGRPKGVPITHGNIINSTEGRLSFYPINPQAFLLMSSISFDSSKAGIFWTLCTGGNLVLTEDRLEQDIDKLQEVIFKNKISHTLMLPTLYGLLIEYGNKAKLQSLNTVLVAGEVCSLKLCKMHFDVLPKVALYNEYGPTEATVWCLAHKIELSDTLGDIPLGKPVANAEIYLLNEQRNLVPVGAVGEIYVGGAGLAGRYHKRPDLSEEAYVLNPFRKGAEEKLYKTGDLGRYNADGTIKFLGRSDQQVKIRGHRVELNEIERILKNEQEIQEAVVLVETVKGIKRINAFIIANSPIEFASINKKMRSMMPEYMVPATISQVDEFPQLPNGKVDKKALSRRKQDMASSSSKKEERPSTLMESKIMELWKELLGLESIGINDNFFHIGGDSILSIQFIAKARKAGILITPNQIFDYQTISELANFIKQNEDQTEDWNYLVALRKEGYKKPLFCIHAGGGHVFFYNVLTKYIDSDRPIYALQAAGFYGNKQMHGSIVEMARDYIAAMRAVQKEGPYNIMVYCFSVSVGHEMLLQFRKLGFETNLIIMDTITDPWRMNTPERLKMRIRGFFKLLLKEPIQTVKLRLGLRLLSIKLLINKKLGTKEDKSLSRVNANLAKICMAYQWVPHNDKVTLLLTQKLDKNINKMIISAWKNIALGGVNVIMTKGDHTTLFTEPDVAFVAKKLDENCL